MAGADADRQQVQADDGQEQTGGEADRREAPHPDRAVARGNPEIETLDVDRGLDKIERVSGN